MSDSDNALFHEFLTNHGFEDESHFAATNPSFIDSLLASTPRLTIEEKECITRMHAERETPSPFVRAPTSNPTKSQSSPKGADSLEECLNLAVMRNTTSLYRVEGEVLQVIVKPQSLTNSKVLQEMLNDILSEQQKMTPHLLQHLRSNHGAILTSKDVIANEVIHH